MIVTEHRSVLLLAATGIALAAWAVGHRMGYEEGYRMAVSEADECP